MKSSDPSKKRTTDSVNFNDRAEMKASDPLTIGSKLKQGSNSGSHLNDRVDSGGHESMPKNKYGIVEYKDPVNESSPSQSLGSSIQVEKQD